MYSSRSLDRLHVGELLIVYHTLCGAEHMSDKLGLKTVEAKLMASYQRLMPSLGVTPQENCAVRHCFNPFFAMGSLMAGQMKNMLPANP